MYNRQQQNTLMKLIEAIILLSVVTYFVVKYAIKGIAMLCSMTKCIFRSANNAVIACKKNRCKKTGDAPK